MARSKKKVKTIHMAITDVDVDALIEFGKQNRNKKISYSFLEEFKNQPETHIDKMVCDLLNILMNYMEQHLDGCGNTAKNWASSNAEKVNMIGQLMQVAVDIALATLQLKFHMTSHVQLAVLLNGILSFMPDTLDSVRNSIAQYCEKVCLTKTCDRAEYFLFNVFPYLFQRTLGPKGLKTDIKRIYAIRAHLEAVMNFKETKKEEMWGYFNQAILSAHYLSIMEGQKIIALAFTFDADRIVELHAKVAELIPEMNIKFASGYGKIYFEAWCYAIKHDKLDVKDGLEINCLQELIDGAITSEHRMVMPVTRKMLTEFHYHKKEKSVSDLLHNLYQPIIWRYLKNPSGRVRAHTAQLFLDIFPFEGTEFNRIHAQNDLNIQLNMLRELLEDEFPIVRITTTLALCISLSVNWEVYPEEMIKTYFKIMINDLGRDGAHPEVRCAVVKGLKCLLENPLTVRCLIHLLPKLHGLFHDISENVRIAFCQLLLRIKTISAIKYFEIVPPSQLLARLAEDCPTVQKSITSLLSNSYFPANQDEKLWFGRCLEILRIHRDGSRVLFTHIHHHAEFHKLVNFMIHSTRSLHFYVNAKKNSASLENSNKENIVNVEEYMNNLEQAVGFSNLNIVSALMEAIIIMWLSLKQKMDLKKRRNTIALNRYSQSSASTLRKRRYTELKKEIVKTEQENKHTLKMFVAKIGACLRDLCLYYKDTEAWEAVFYTASFLPPNDVPKLGSLLFNKFKDLPLDAKREDYLTLLECVCNQRQAKELLNLLKEWLEVGLSDSYVPPPSAKKRRRSKRAENVCHDQPKPYLANEMLDIILTNRCLQKCAFQYPKDVLEIVYLFDHIKLKLEKFNARVMNETEANFLGLLMHNILRLIIFLQFHNELNGAKYLNEMVEWTQSKLIPHLTFSDEGTENYTTLVHSICMNLCRTLSDAAGLGFVIPNCQMPLLYFEKLLTSELGYKYALITARFLYKFTATCQYNYLMDNETVMYKNLLESLARVLVIFSNETLLESIPTEDYRSVQFTLGNVMQVLHNVLKVLVKPSAKVYKLVVSNVIDSVLEKTKVIVEELSDEPFEKIAFPKVGAFFNYMVNQKPQLIPTYMKFLNELYNSSSKDISHWIAYWIVLNNALGRKSEMSRSILNETHSLVGNLGKTLYKLYPRERTSRSSSSRNSSETPKMQLFQQHCHAELLKLKNLQIAKVAAVKLVESKKII